MTTVTSQELRELLTLASKAPTTLGDAYGFKATVDKFVALANQSHPIGAIAPSDVGSSSSDPDANAGL